MKVYSAICVEDWAIEAENGDPTECYGGCIRPKSKSRNGEANGMTPTQKARESYRREAEASNGASAWVIRHCSGMYFAGFGDTRRPGATPVKWVVSLADAKLFNASALSQAEKYIERIKQKDSLYVGLKAVKVFVMVDGGRP